MGQLSARVFIHGHITEFLNRALPFSDQRQSRRSLLKECSQRASGYALAGCSHGSTLADSVSYVGYTVRQVTSYHVEHVFDIPYRCGLHLLPLAIIFEQSHTAIALH
jgi:hypothetical protein